MGEKEKKRKKKEIIFLNPPSIQLGFSQLMH
jgi:hypothetical protein